MQLAEVLCAIPSLDIPRQLPKNDVAVSHWAGDDKDPKGSIVRGELSDEFIYAFKGVLGHFHVEEMKIDPGVNLFEYFITNGW